MKKYKFTKLHINKHNEQVNKKKERIEEERGEELGKSISVDYKILYSYCQSCICGNKFIIFYIYSS